MQRSCGGVKGMRTKMPRATRPDSTARAKSPSRPQSIVTKFVADSSGVSPLSRAISPIRSRAAAMSFTTRIRCPWSASAAMAPACASRPTPKWLRMRLKAATSSGAASP
jgi:hypothetical protein